MTADDLPPLDADVADVVRAERRIPEPSAELKARMLAAVSSRVGGPSGGGDGGGSPRGGKRAPSFVLSGWRTPAAIAAAFLLGFATNAAFTSSTVVTAPRAGDSASAPVPITLRTPASATIDVPVSAASALPDAPTPPRASASAAPEPDNRGLAGERTLLDVARTALANGDAERALAAVARHEKAYPNGLLVEEREAIAVKALVAAGRNDEARARGARYAKRFPSGLMRPAVDGALRSIPESP